MTNMATGAPKSLERPSESSRSEMYPLLAIKCLSLAPARGQAWSGADDAREGK
jgi:hypothetical protein